MPDPVDLLLEVMQDPTPAAACPACGGVVRVYREWHL